MPFVSTFNVLGEDILVKDKEANLNITNLSNKLLNYDNLYYNVKDYGAKGDGITNDYSAILNCINACPTDCVVFFPNGTYIIETALTISKRVALKGLSAKIINNSGSVIINNTNTGLVLEGITFYSNSGSCVITKSEGAEIKNCSFTCNGENVYCVEAYGSYTYIYNNGFSNENSEGYCLKLGCDTNLHANINSKIIKNLFSQVCNGLYVSGYSGKNIEGVTISDNTFICTGNISISLNYFYYVGIVNNIIDLCKQYAVRIQNGTSLKVVANYVSAATVGNEQICFRFSTSNNISVVGNQIGQSLYGFYVESNCNGLTVDGNTFSNIQSAGISTYCPATIISNNVFLSTQFSIQISDISGGNFIVTNNYLKNTNQDVSMTNPSANLIKSNNIE